MRARHLVTAAGMGALVQLGPAVTSIAPLRRALAPGLSGIGAGHHVALSYDDGPDPASTPRFLDLLERRDVRATFFLLGEHVVGEPALVRAMADAGHELAVHGWTHTCLAASPPGRIVADLRRTRAAIEDLTGQRVRWYRPPYGVLTTEGLVAARRTGLRTVLWSAWGRDWTRRASPRSIEQTVRSALRPGDTVLLHDTDRTSAPGSWRRTLTASVLLLDHWADLGLPVGTLGEHAGPAPGGA